MANSPAQTTTQQFIQPTIEGTGGTVVNLVAGDFNNTGLSDILYLNAPVIVNGVSQVTAGQLTQQQSFGYQNLTGNQIIFTNVSNVVATVADFDGDGILDFAFVTSPTVGGTPKLCVYYGTASGTIGNAYNISKSGCMSFPLQGTQSPNFAYIAALPFTTKGVPNILVEDSVNNWTYVLANNGQVNPAGGVLTTFSLNHSFLGTDSVGPIYPGDYNNDGKTDFLVNSLSDHSFTEWVGDGSGNFSASTQGSAPGQVRSMLVHDMDGDGHLDLIAEGPNGVISIYHGNADSQGTFAGLTAPGASIGGTGLLDGTSGNGGHLIAVAAVNGALNLLTSTPIGVSLLLGQSNLTYLLGGIYNVGPGRTAYAVADFNGDLQLDLAVDSPEGVAISYGKKGGTFAASMAYPAGAPALSGTVNLFRTPAGGNPSDNLDVVVATAAAQGQILFGNGNGTFSNTSTSTTTLPVMTPPNLWSNLLTGDFNGDGVADIVYSLTGLPLPTPGTSAGSGLYVQYGVGDGTFEAPVAITPQNAPANNNFYGESAVAILNGNPVADIANADALYFDTVLSQGAGNYAVGLNRQEPSPQSFSLVAAGKVLTNKSTLQDLVFQSGANITPYLNSGDGKNFTVAANLTNTPPISTYFPAAILIRDMDGDGNSDIVVPYYNVAANPAIPSTATPNQLYIWYGKGDGTFGAPAIAQLSRNYYLAAIADINSDGKPDLVLSDGYLVSVLLNTGNRAFGDEFHLLAGQGINSLSLADLNGDGTPDIVVANGGATISNPLALGAKTPGTTSLTLPVNPDVVTGGVTVLLNFYHTNAVTGTLTATPEPSMFGATFSLTATITPVIAGVVPTGTVQFSIDGAPVGSPVALGASGANGTATYVIAAGNTYAIGPHAIGAIYSGDASYSGTALNGTHTVIADTLIPTTTVLALCVEGSAQFPCPANPQTPPPLITPLTMYYGQVFNGTENASANDGSALSPASLLYFYDGSTLLCTITVASGQQCPASVGMSGSYSVGANVFTSIYGGDATHAQSTSNAVTINVLPDITTATLTSSLNPARTGQAVTFTVTLTGNYAAPTGSVTLTELFPPTAQATLLGTATLVPGVGLTSTATFTLSNLPIGTDTLIAGYAGSPDFMAVNSSPLSQVITPPLTTSTTVTSNINPSALGQIVTFTATVAAVGLPSQIPTGTVTFLDGGTAIGSGVLNASGVATYATPSLAAGKHNITASYPGDSATMPGVSPVYVQVVASNTFSMTVTPTPVSVGVGRSASLVVSVSMSLLSPAVTLGCSNLPIESACTFAQATIPAGGGSTTLLVSTMAPHACGTNQPYFLGSARPGGWPLPQPGATPILAGLAVFGFGLGFGMRGRRRLAARLFAGLFALLALTTTLQLSGCGNCTDLGTTPGTYSIQVTATGVGNSSQVASQAVTVHVTP